MFLDEYRTYCLSKPGTSEGFPFDETTLVFKVMGKIFAITDIDTFEFVNLKCDPIRAIELRESHDGIRPGYHMNKKSWNSVYTAFIGNQLLKELTDHSYDLIVSGLTKKDQLALKELSK
jgi:predicted DNA-binding protein (MmcQ/YjbR family)